MIKPFYSLYQDERDRRINRILKYTQELGADDIVLISASEFLWTTAYCLNVDFHVKFTILWRFTIRTRLHRLKREKWWKAIIKRSFLRKRPTVEDFAGEKIKETKNWTSNSFRVHEIASKTEFYAFYQGFYFALSFSGRKCRVCGSGGGCKGFDLKKCPNP